MQIHPKRRTIYFIGILVIVFMGLYPPWLHTRSHGLSYSEVPAGYSFILSAPTPEYRGAGYGVKIDTTKLFIQWVLVIGVVGAFVLFTNKEEKEIPKT